MMKIFDCGHQRYAISILLLFLVGIAHHYLVVNTTKSFPPGIYRKTHEKPEKGHLVLFCPPKLDVFAEARQRKFLGPGLCPSGTDSMIKKIVAIHGDHVRISSDGVSINGAMQEHSEPKITMLHGISMPHEKTLTAREVLLLSPHPLSFDGRYFGTLQKDVIETTLEPFWLWEE